MRRLGRISRGVIGCMIALSIVQYFCAPNASAQNPGDTRPTVGLRSNRGQPIVLTNATVVLRPGKVLENASILIDEQAIVDVGNEVDPPAGAERIDCSGKTIYPAFIDGFGEIDVDENPNDGVGHWNGYVLPRRRASAAVRNVGQANDYRKQGIAIRLIAPRGGIIKGRSCLVLLDQSSRGSLIGDDVAQHAELSIPRDRRRDSYPNSPMGAVALLRQTLLDADWYVRAAKAWQANPKLQRPVRNDDLARIAEDCSAGRFVFDAPNERMAIRARDLAREFSLDAILRGSGREYRDLATIASAAMPILVPVDFPKAPDVTSEAAAADVDLRTLMHWHFAPENPKRLAEANATICFTTDGLDNGKAFLDNVRQAVDRGLPADDALTAMTTAPAKLFQIDHLVGEIQPGLLANLVITDGDLFAEKTKLLETWVAGKRFEHSPTPSESPFAGDWDGELAIAGTKVPLRMVLKQDKQKWSGKFVRNDREEKSAKSSDASEEEKSDQPEHADFKDLTHAIDRVTAWVDLSKLDEGFPNGPSRLTIVAVHRSAESVPSLITTVTLVDGTSIEPRWKRLDSPVDQSKEKEPAKPPKPKTFRSLAEIAVNYPLGGYGVTETIPTEPAVLFRGATVWTSGPQGTLKNADVLIVDGKIREVGEKLQPPKNCKVIDVKGKHLSAGLIDCHSHMATDGGVNESGQAVTAEVRVGDFVDNSDIHLYRQLAGGLTSSNILHGSANPIGGQNQVIKLRWGDSMQELKFASAPEGIKFALGENVKRSNRRERSTRYPGSRMGVPEIMRDRFLAALEYTQAHQRYRQGIRKELPPRRDLELEAIAEILQHDRWIHCHSYRQDEIVALLDLLDEYEITIGTLQHILEGYKVADRMREHGAMASSFSDWWAYKFEVYDAIPDNGAIMHEQGLIVSFNSDDRELARHLNTEAAKAMKYGGVPAEEALKFVTLNPAKQLRIDDRVGSIEAGKDADLVVWSGPPLSTLSRCEQTWVDGRLMFSLQQDQQLRQRDARWRQLLINYILAGDVETDSGEAKPIDEEDRWLRYDEFCHGHDHDHDGHDHDGHDHHEHEEVQR